MSAKERQKGKVTKDSVTLLPCFYFVEVSGRYAERAGRGLAAGAGSGAEPIRGERGAPAGSGLASVLSPHRLMQNPYVMLYLSGISIEAPYKEEA